MKAGVESQGVRVLSGPSTEVAPSIQSLLGQNLSTARDGWSRFCAMPAARERQSLS